MKVQQLHERYEQFAPITYADHDQDPADYRSVTNYLSKPLKYDFFEQNDENRCGEYEVVGPEPEVSVEMKLEGRDTR